MCLFMGTGAVGLGLEVQGRSPLSLLTAVPTRLADYSSLVPASHLLVETS